MTHPPGTPRARTEPIYLVIARHIRNDIAAGRLRDGHQLPSTRELADEWGVSVEPVNRAMGVLADEGLIINRDRSRRTVVSDVELQPTASTFRPTTPTAVIIGGYAGSGKTELGRILARQTGWPILDKDTLTRPVVEAALEQLGQLPSDRESDTYLTVVRPAEYEALRAGVSENIQCGNSAIVTAPFIRELADRSWCDRTAASLESLGAKLAVVWVQCDAVTMRTYLKHRGAARDTWKMANWDTYLEGINLEFEPVIEHHVIQNSSGSRPLQVQAKEILKSL